MMIKLALMFFLTVGYQYGWPAVQKPDAPVELTARAMSYDPFTLGSELIVEAPSDGKYLRLLYSPFDWGFDAHEAQPSQMMPQEMFRDGSVVWKFTAHPAMSDQQKLLCNSVSKSAIKGNGEHDYILLPRKLTKIPGSEDKELPAVQTMPCLIVLSWENTKTGARGPERSSRLIP
jgi:hypothetical protein